MNKNELIRTISSSTGVSKNRTSKILDSFFGIITDTVKKGENVTLHHFGSFKRVTKEGRPFYNLITQNRELLPRRSYVKFIPFHQLRASIKQDGLTNEEKIIPSLPISTGSSKNGNRPIASSAKFNGNRNKTKSSKNLGERRAVDTSEYHNNRFDYIGTVEYDCFLGENEHTTFPAIKTPQKGTKILKWYKSSKEAIVGVTEPLLVAEVEKLCQKFEGLTILNNIALPILNREYSYRPDIALYWEKYGILLDIEIDEPYDICSRKPTHYIGCADNLRDKYFIRNGWSVIRYSENQVSNHMAEVICHLEFILNWLSSQTAKGYIHIEDSRWTYDEATQFADSYKRENDLGVERQHGHLEVKLQSPSRSYESFIKPDIDILPQNVEISHNPSIESQFNYAMASNADYVRITDIAGREWVLEKKTIKKENQNDETHIVGNNILIPFLKGYPFRSLSKVEAISSLYTDHWRSEDNNSNRDILIKAARTGSPIWIKYRNGQGSKSERYLSNLCLFLHHIDAQMPFTDLGTIVINNKSQWEYYLFGFCSMRHEFRQFACDARLSEVKIVNCKNTYIWGNAYQNSLAELVMHPYNYWLDYSSRVDYLIGIMPKKEKESLLSKGNLAHYEVIKGNINKALKMYLQIPFNTNMNLNGDQECIWGKVCIKDIDRFIDEGKKTEDNKYSEITPSRIVNNFSKVKSLLIENGWLWND